MPIVTFLDPRNTRGLRRRLRARLPVGWQFPVTAHTISTGVIALLMEIEERVHAGARNQQTWEQA